MPKVSIGLPVRNGQIFLRQTIDSLLAQTFGDFELVICDNASTDATEEIVRSYGAMDRRIRYIRHATDIGAVPNYNYAFGVSNAPYFRWHSYDDLCEPEYLEKCAALLDRDETSILAHSQTVLIDEEGEPLAFDPVSGLFADASGLIKAARPDPLVATSPDPIARFQDALSRVVACNHLYGLMRASALRRTGLLGLYYNSDRALLVEMAFYGRFTEIPEVLFYKREHPSNSRLLTPKQRARFVGASVWSSRLITARNYLQLLQCIYRSPLSGREKATCLGAGIRKMVASRVPGFCRMKAAN